MRFCTLIPHIPLFLLPVAGDILDFALLFPHFPPHISSAHIHSRNNMKAVICDLFSQAALEELRSHGIECLYDHTLKGPHLLEALAAERPQILVVRSTKVTADLIQAAPSLELIVRAGAGTDNIDTAEASKRGIYVTNCPGKNSIAVAELVMGLICAVDRRIPENVMLLRQGKWNKGLFSASTGLKGRKLGIIGIGNIGREVAARARSFGMTIFGFDPMLNAEQTEAMGITYLPSPEALAHEVDIMTFHVPSTPKTKGMINAQFLGQCKDDCVVINTSRGDLVNEDELLSVLDARPGLWYACDVYKGEPADKEGDFVHRVAQHPRVYGTHHIGASTKQAEQAIGEEAVRVILKYSRTRKVDLGNCVNLVQLSPANYSMTIRTQNSPGILAFALSKMTEAGYNVQEVENVVFKDAVACSASINFTAEGPERVEEVVAAIQGHAGVINVVCLPRVR